MEEIWKPITDYIEYEVSNFGNVRQRAYRIVYDDGTSVDVPARPVAQTIDSHGYACVSLRQRQYKVHRLVAQAFCPRSENDTKVMHIDGNSLNNVHTNLKWISYDELYTSIRNKYKDRYGAAPGRRIICVDTHEAFISIKAAAMHYNISYTTLRIALSQHRKCKGMLFKYIDSVSDCESSYVMNLKNS